MNKTKQNEIDRLYNLMNKAMEEGRYELSGFLADKLNLILEK